MTSANDESTSVSQQAARWWVALHKVDSSAAEKREFAEWVTRAPERAEACLRVARVHAAVSRADVPWPATSTEELVRNALATPDDSVVPLRPYIRPKREEERRPAMRWVAGLAASVAIAACLGWWLTVSRA